LIKIEEITSLDGLNSLSAEWGGLWDRCPTATPFQLPGWIVPWCKCFCGENEIFTVAIRAEGRLVALAPLLIEPAFGKEKTRRLVFMGTGISDYLDMIAEPGMAGESARLVLEKIYGARSKWDICHFEELRENSPFFHLTDFGGLGHEFSPMSVCPVLALPEDPEKLKDNYSAALRQSLKKARKSLLKTGDVLFESAPPGNTGDFLDEFFSLHEKWWSGLRHSEGVLQGKEIRAFHREAARNLLALGMLRLYGFRVNGRLSAIIYGFASRGRFYAYLGGFEPSLDRMSPGSLAIEYAMRQCIEECIREFDFLRGSEKYKYNWGAKDGANYRLKLFH